MQVLLLLHEVPLEMTCLLLFVFSNFLPKLKQLLALYFCLLPLLWAVLFLFWDGFSKWLSTGAQQEHSEHRLEQRSCGEKHLPLIPQCWGAQWPVAIINWDLPPSVLQILQPGPELPVLVWGLGFPLTKGCVACFKALSVDVWHKPGITLGFIPLFLHFLCVTAA